jgi:hypothetical protein
LTASFERSGRDVEEMCERAKKAEDETKKVLEEFRARAEPAADRIWRRVEVAHEALKDSVIARTKSVLQAHANDVAQDLSAVRSRVDDFAVEVSRLRGALSHREARVLRPANGVNDSAYTFAGRKV